MWEGNVRDLRNVVNRAFEAVVAEEHDQEEPSIQIDHLVRTLSVLEQVRLFETDRQETIEGELKQIAETLKTVNSTLARRHKTIEEQLQQIVNEIGPEVTREGEFQNLGYILGKAILQKCHDLRMNQSAAAKVVGISAEQLSRNPEINLRIKNVPNPWKSDDRST